MGDLYIVATPIGNLGDVSTRMSEILGKVDAIVAEDTRVTRRLTAHLNLKVRLISYHGHSSERQQNKILALLEEWDLALVTDAGTPCISDPGSRLVRLARERGHRVIPIPGPSAVTTLLSASGFSADKFNFWGFLPRTSARRVRVLQGLITADVVVVFFESPHRIQKTLQELADIIPDRQICVGRELTKLYEEIFVGTPQDAIEKFSDAKGEFVVVVNTKPKRSV